MSHQDRTRWLTFAGLCALLLAIAVGVLSLGTALMPTLGIAVFAAALLLPPRMTALVAAVAVALGTVLALTQDAQDMGIRIFNVTVAALLAVAASWFLQHRRMRLEQARRTEADVLASIPDVVMVLDGDGRLLQGNPATAALLPSALPGERVHPILGHVLADGSLCQGGCVLDGRLPDPPTGVPVHGESITRAGRTVPVAYSSGHVLDRGLVVTLRDVSAQAAALQDRRVLLAEAARQREQERLVAELRDSRPAALPQVAGLEMDLWSTASREDPLVGADVVDIGHLPDGRALMLLVDAAGQGIAALRDAWKVMYACRAHLAAGAPLAELVGRCARTMAEDESPRPTATVLAVVLDPQTGHLQAALGGHPPPLIVRGNGSAEWTEAAGQGIGAPSPGSQAVGSAVLSPGDTMVLFTDGVVDRSSDVLEGLSALRSTAVALREEALEGWSRRTLEAVFPRFPLRGEATLLAVRLGR